jgi:hypothetical protein
MIFGLLSFLSSITNSHHFLRKHLKHCPFTSCISSNDFLYCITTLKFVVNKFSSFFLHFQHRLIPIYRQSSITTFLPLQLLLFIVKLECHV